ncbi:ParA family protein [Ornithinimicrobium sp. LYQ121]|uniref:ParA family protein n=2 Tax=unclassified Ornithinimicrobium TaxID=2615080 RepID=UPI0038530E41
MTMTDHGVLGWPARGTGADPRELDRFSTTSPLGWPSSPERARSRPTARNGSGGQTSLQGDIDVSRETGPASISNLGAGVTASTVSRETTAAPPEAPRHLWSGTRIMTVANQKGGVGKTTSAVNLAAAMAEAGLRVLVLDMDPQGNASTALSIDHRSGTPGIYDVLIDGMPLADVVQECPQLPGLLCAPATIDLAGAEIELVPLVARENRLRRALTAYLDAQTGAEEIDLVLIDCPPSLGLLTVNAFVAAREVLIPIQCEYYALEGLSQLLKNVELIQLHLNADLQVSTILLTMFDARTRLAADVAGQVREHFGPRVLRAAIPRSVRISEAPSHGETVITYDPASTGALSYLEAAAEMREQEVRA